MSYRQMLCKGSIARSLKRPLARPSVVPATSTTSSCCCKLFLIPTQRTFYDFPSRRRFCQISDAIPVVSPAGRYRHDAHDAATMCIRLLSSSSAPSNGNRSASSSDSGETMPSAGPLEHEVGNGETATTAQPQCTPPTATSMNRLYDYLNLETFQKDELEAAFDRIVDSHRRTHGNTDNGSEDATSATLDVQTLQTLVYQQILESEQGNGETNVMDKSSCEVERHRYAALEAQNLMNLLGGESLTKNEFVKAVRRKAMEIDVRRTLPITASMLLVGSSVGIISPALPFIVAELGLTSTQFGMSVSAFALAKMLSNVPSAIAVERHGRKPYMIYSLAVVALATAGIGFSSSFEELYVCRLLTGVGVAALSTGATMMMTDISTPLNRATTIAPIMSAFSAGTAVGPALGGYLVDSVGLHPTFYVVGLSFLGVAAINRITMEETKRQPIHFPWQTDRQAIEASSESIPTAVKSAVAQWAPLMQNSGVRSVMIMNALYWAALAGSQMTLLPLILTEPEGLAMSATQVGQAYMGMSLLQIFGNPLFARLADRYGKVTAIVGGCSLISASMVGLTFCHDYSQLAVALGVWATGSSLLSTAPVAYVSDKVNESQRAQALALLRTLGDVGFLVGAMSSGALADWTGSLDVAMLASAGFLLSGTLWFSRRQAIVRKLLLSRVKEP